MEQIRPTLFPIDVDRVMELMTDHYELPPATLDQLVFNAVAPEYRRIKMSERELQDYLKSVRTVFLYTINLINTLISHIDTFGDSNGTRLKGIKDQIAKTRKSLTELKVDTRYFQTDRQLLELLNTLL